MVMVRHHTTYGMCHRLSNRQQTLTVITLTTAAEQSAWEQQVNGYFML